MARDVVTASGPIHSGADGYGGELDGASEAPNVARVLNRLRSEEWCLDRLLYVGEQILVVAAG